MEQKEWDNSNMKKLAIEDIDATVGKEPLRSIEIAYVYKKEGMQPKYVRFGKLSDRFCQ
ncbi:MAG TPA: hypothetical protein K8W06_04755 [Limosilactobacillus coleohominis]|nr:hypothetical protein [Limosilactobacillus coleohominis]